MRRRVLVATVGLLALSGGWTVAALSSPAPEVPAAVVTPSPTPTPAPPLVPVTTTAEPPAPLPVATTTRRAPAATTTRRAPATVAPTTRRAAPAPPAPRAVAPAPAPAPARAYYANCDAVRAAGAAPLRTSDPGYRSGLDRDHDGLACEPES